MKFIFTVSSWTFFECVEAIRKHRESGREKLCSQIQMSLSLKDKLQKCMKPPLKLVVIRLPWQLPPNGCRILFYCFLFATFGWRLGNMPIISPPKPLQSVLVCQSLSGEIQGKALIVFMSLCLIVFIYQDFKCCLTTMCLELSGLTVHTSTLKQCL